MSGLDLAKLAATTKDYAEFQARKSGLATALGGLMAVLLIILPMYQDAMFRQIGRVLVLDIVLLLPLLWLGLKQVLSHTLYHGLGDVKAALDSGYERRRVLWLFGIAMFLLLFLTASLGAFVFGIFGLPREMTALTKAQACLPLPWFLGFPVLYMALAPWWLRGIEETRAYAVLVVECCLWIWCRLTWGYWPWIQREEVLGFSIATVVGVLLLTLGVMAWGALAMVRGWREHREYLAILNELPATDSLVAAGVESE